MIAKFRARAILSAILLAITTPAFAAPGDVAEAARLDALAAKLAQGGANKEALAALRQSQVLAPKRTTLEKIAALQRKSNDFAGAYATLADGKVRYGAEMSPKDRADLQRQLDELAAITGGLHIKVVEEGARVEVDGVAAGTGPFDATVRVGLGAHAVRVTKPGRDAFEWKGDAAAGRDVEIVAELRGIGGNLAVRVRGAGGEIQIDGKSVGPSPVELPLPPGRHTVEIAGVANSRREIEVVSGETATVELQGDESGRLSLSATGLPDAQISIDGAVVGRGTWEDKLTPGPHDVEISQPGYEPVHLRVIVRPGMVATEKVQLVKAVEPPRFDGVYAIFAGNFTGSPVAHNFVTDACGVDPDSCKAGGRGAIGGAIPIRVGYSFGFIEIEGVSQVRYDQAHVDQTVSAVVPKAVGFTVYRVTVANGIEARYEPRLQGVRPSVALGLAWAHEILGVSTQGGNRIQQPSTHGDAPMFMFDAGVLFGRTPGGKFRLALEGTVEATGGGFSDPTEPSVKLARGAVFFLGPSLGVQIGH
jgi:hypothetical protein